MKKIIGSALVALALVGSVATASAGSTYNSEKFPDHSASLSQSLAFWQQFSDNND